MRLIDADEMEELFNAQIALGATDLFAAFEDALQDAQTVDAVPVVRCKDCKWFADNHNGDWVGCWLYNAIRANENDSPKADNFCYYGERRDDG